MQEIHTSKYTRGRKPGTCQNSTATCPCSGIRFTYAGPTLSLPDFGYDDLIGLCAVLTSLLHIFSWDLLLPTGIAKSTVNLTG